MFSRHETKNLSAYAHGELAGAEAERAARHLAACARCRAEFEEIKLGIRLAESLPTRTAPAHLWDGIEAALVNLPAGAGASEFGAGGRAVGGGRELEKPRAGRRFPALARPFGWRPALTAAGVGLAVVCGALVWVYIGATRGTWEVASLQGSPKIVSGRVVARNRLGVGDWLETDAHSRAELKVANIGRVEVDPETRLRLVETGLTEHRIELARGRLHARIWAPPRIFFVNTPSAVAADLGCAYTLETDDAGRSLLRVTSGWVAFETETRESIVPAGAACVTQPGTGPGTPYFEDASPAFVEALSRFDFAGGGEAALAVLLREARERDTLTLWHLLARTPNGARGEVYERLARLSPPPAGVTRDGALALDKPMLAAWRDDLERRWFAQPGYNIKGAWRTLKEKTKKFSGGVSR